MIAIDVSVMTLVASSSSFWVRSSAVSVLISLWREQEGCLWGMTSLSPLMQLVGAREGEGSFFHLVYCGLVMPGLSLVIRKEPSWCYCLLMGSVLPLPGQRARVHEKLQMMCLCGVGIPSVPEKYRMGVGSQRCVVLAEGSEGQAPREVLPPGGSVVGCARKFTWVYSVCM